MLCDRCKKNEATIHIETIHNGKRVKTNLCAECAKHEEAHGALAALGFNLAEVLFQKMTGSAAAPAETAKETPESHIVCPVCQWTLEKIKSHNGQLGCPHCYEAFAPMIEEVISKVQKGKLHAGKRPGVIRADQGDDELKLRKLKTLLAELVRREEYEDAARCRDDIRRLEEKLAAPVKKSAAKPKRTSRTKKEEK
ncbi:MAG: UvrB/UvrC motif-containing protein [Victivallaceae bacterium]|nr:UvrB/UvrC motif-containing protein [Victivallaceae bacterium]